MLYWAEGDKRRNTVARANSDPELLVVFARFLRQHFGVPDDAFRVYCNLSIQEYGGFDRPEWLD